jgi:hypothetical protein
MGVVYGAEDTRLNRPAISRDGKYVGQVLSERDQQSLRIRQLETGSELRCVLSPADVFARWCVPLPQYIRQSERNSGQSARNRWCLGRHRSAGPGRRMAIIVWPVRSLDGEFKDVLIA